MAAGQRPSPRTLAPRRPPRTRFRPPIRLRLLTGASTRQTMHPRSTRIHPILHRQATIPPSISRQELALTIKPLYSHRSPLRLLDSTNLERINLLFKLQQLVSQANYLTKTKKTLLRPSSLTKIQDFGVTKAPLRRYLKFQSDDSDELYITQCKAICHCSSKNKINAQIKKQTVSYHVDV